jgi:hypothetical protein
MAKRLGEVLLILGLVIGAILLWAGYHQADGVVPPLWEILMFALPPVIIGGMCYYVLAGGK